jgi:hypothetical protein
VRIGLLGCAATTLVVALGCSLGGPEYCGIHEGVPPTGVATHPDWAWVAVPEDQGGVVCRSDERGTTTEVAGERLDLLGPMDQRIQADGWSPVHVSDQQDLGVLRSYYRKGEDFLSLRLDVRPGWKVTDVSVDRSSAAEIRGVRIGEAPPECTTPCADQLKTCLDGCAYESTCVAGCEAAGDVCFDACL